MVVNLYASSTPPTLWAAAPVPLVSDKSSVLEKSDVYFTMLLSTGLFSFTKLSRATVSSSLFSLNPMSNSVSSEVLLTLIELVAVLVSLNTENPAAAPG